MAWCRFSQLSYETCSSDVKRAGASSGDFLALICLLYLTLGAFLSSEQAEKDQRLIYSGKLLTDNLHLTDVFRKVTFIYLYIF